MDMTDIPDGYRLIDWRAGFSAIVGPFYEKTGPNGAYARAFRVSANQTNGLGNAHGGMLLTFADMAFGNAVNAQRSLWWVTVRLTCDFLSSAKIGDWVEGSAEIIGQEEDLFTVRGRVWVGERTVMTGQGVFKGLAPKDDPNRQ